jgi:hypothetical protein
MRRAIPLCCDGRFLTVERAKTVRRRLISRSVRSADASLRAQFWKCSHDRPEIDRSEVFDHRRSPRARLGG